MFLRRIYLSLTALMLSVLSMADNSRLYDGERLSSSLTSAICQDRYGYIWIGTEYGLNKFDGYRFTPYFSNESDSTTLYNNDITSLFVDGKGRLWVGQSKGLARYDYMTNRFVHYTINGRKPRVSAMLEHNGLLLIGTSGYGLFTLKDGASVAEKLPLSTHRRTDDFCSSLFVDANGDIWRASHLHLVTRYKRGKDGIYTQKDYPLTPKGPAVEFLGDGDKGFWVICMYGIMRYDYAKRTLTDAGIDLSVIDNTVTMRTATFDAKGNMLIGTSGGGLMVLPRGGKLIHATGNGKDILLHSTNVNNILCDRQGGVWLSCYGKGIYRTGSGDEAFSSHTFSGNKITLGSRVTSTAYCYGAIWCTVQYSGLYRFDADGNNLRIMDSPQGTNLVYRDHSGQMWICTNNALYRYFSDGTYEKAAQMNGFGLNAMTDDGNGKLYISDFGRGLVVYDTRSGKSVSYSMNDKPKRAKDNVLHNDWIKSLCMVTPETLVIGTVEGLQAMNTKNGSFGPIQFNGILCSAILKTDNSQLLVGTISGLYTYNLHTAVEQPMNGAEMLRDKKICAIRKDRYGNIWVSTSAGIWKKPANGNQWQGYIHGNGLVTKEYVLGASFALPGGEIGFATADGITFFLPETVEKLEQHTADAQLSAVIVGGEMRSPLHDIYVIPHSNNNLSLEFSTMNYNDVDNVTYEYRINSTGKWEPFIEGNNITFTHLPPGTYKIEVRARNGSNVSEHIKVITVRVEHPWYSSPFAYALYIIIGIAALTLVLLYYRRQKRRELDEAKMQFLINATHDIRSPLTLILGPLAKLRGMTNDKRQTDYLNIIERNAQRLLVLVNQILDERKIDKNQMRLHCKRCDISQFVDNICSLYKYRADEKNIRLTFSGSSTPAKAWIDCIQFDKVINNLLSNAFKYTPDNGEIAVGVKDDGKTVTVTVIDNGVGIDGENREKLFERFYQGKNSIKNQTPGTGIGLNLSRTIVKMHGGSITAGNRNDGTEGAQFTVILRHGFQHLKPEYIDEDQAEDTIATTERNTQTTQNANVLVVDDNSDMTQYISNELGGTYRITTCADGMEALNALHRSPFDLVITDVMMPRMDGIELLRTIKQTPRLNHIPVIMLTSKSEIEDRLAGLRKGVDAYMAKPFNIEELQAQIAAIIDNVRRLRGKYSGQLHTDDGVIKAPEVTGNDDSFMERVITTINANLGNPYFNVEMLAREICVSRAHLHRKMKEITGISASEYIRNIRIEHASRIIKENKINITQVAYAVGFNNQAHFSTVFKKHFGMTPSEYAAKHCEN